MGKNERAKLDGRCGKVKLRKGAGEPFRPPLGEGSPECLLHASVLDTFLGSTEV